MEWNPKERVGELNPKERVGGLYPKERVGQPKPVTYSIQKHGLHTTDKKEWAVSTRIFSRAYGILFRCLSRTTNVRRG